ncbi:hypothetical protein Poli38472_006689 [Pythium oligandrum]|uniref:Uncharacterized protein n=1 Tax=Pythium oligandrum TaxID=41045 RepID=A0A8K1C512_PYTOL|nr:hypothetical protein Poli38472_006689 [Pythium oligandrum]|eukprot:TMW56679.1 hypothetical protein Poli38472_006689 [Pythium oligandrum]
MMRPTALRQLQRATASAAVGNRALLVHADPFSGAYGAASWFSTSQKKQQRNGRSAAGVHINDIPLTDLATLPKNKVMQRHGRGKYMRMVKTLPEQLQQLVTDSKPSRDVLKHVFYAADKCNAPDVMLNALRALEAQQIEKVSGSKPRSIDFAVYTVLYNALLRSNLRDRMLAVYEDARTTLPRPLPEVVYRFGIVGKFGADDLDGVLGIVEEMQGDQVAITNEMGSQLMLGFAKANETDQAMRFFQIILEGDVTKLHEQDMNRIILAFGCIGDLHGAFEFYRQCQLPLSTTVFNALLSVCVHNDAPKEAHAIMKNRVRFGLTLDSVGYMRVLEALELFDRHDQIVHILNEMRQQDIPFAPKVNEIVQRNQEYLLGTAFAIRPVESTEHPSGVLELLRDSITTKDTGHAASLADLLVSTVRSSDVNLNMAEASVIKRLIWLGATVVESSEAADLVVQAFLDSNQQHKLQSLVRGFQLVKGDFDAALNRLFEFYSEKNIPEMVDGILSAMLHQDARIEKLDDAFTIFADRDNLDAVQRLLTQSFKRYNEALERHNGDISAASQELPFSVHGILDNALDCIVRASAFDQIISVLDNAESHGVKLGQEQYVRIVAAMKTRNRKDLEGADAQDQQSDANETYCAEHVASLWQDAMRRNIPIQKALIAASSPLLAAGNSTQRRLLWDAYVRICEMDSTADDYALQTVVHEHLMEVAVKDLTSTEAVAVYEAAAEPLAQANQGVPASLTVALIEKLVSEEQIESAIARMLGMRKPPPGALAVTLRAAAERDPSDPRVVELLDLQLQQKRGLGFALATSMITAAERSQARELAWRVVEAYEYRKVKPDMGQKGWKALVKNLTGLREHKLFYEGAMRVLLDDEDANDKREILDERLGGLNELESELVRKLEASS